MAYRRSVRNLDVDPVVNRLGISGVPVDTTRARPRVVEVPPNGMLAVERQHGEVVEGAGDARSRRRLDEPDKQGRKR